MNSATRLLPASLAVLLTVASCQQPSELIDPAASSNLLSNGSFELHGNSSLLGWTPENPDTNLVRISTDVPINGGRYSLSIETVWGPKSTLCTGAPVTPGMHSYRLSLRAKRSGIGGEVTLSHRGSNTTSVSGTLAVQDSDWTHYALLEPVFAQSGDSLIVTLSGGSSQILRGTTWFDMVRLEQLY